jgi:hypothetical protein
MGTQNGSEKQENNVSAWVSETMLSERYEGYLNIASLRSGRVRKDICSGQALIRRCITVNPNEAFNYQITA